MRDIKNHTKYIRMRPSIKDHLDIPNYCASTVLMQRDARHPKAIERDLSNDVWAGDCTHFPQDRSLVVDWEGAVDRPARGSDRMVVV